jgi:hypothetical protein
MNSQPNAVPAHAYYGSPVGGYRLTSVASAHVAAPSGPYLGRDGKCKWADDTCEGFAVKDSEFCVGHTKRVSKGKQPLKAKTGEQVAE